MRKNPGPGVIFGFCKGWKRREGGKYDCTHISGPSRGQECGKPPKLGFPGGFRGVSGPPHPETPGNPRKPPETPRKPRNSGFGGVQTPEIGVFRGFPGGSRGVPGGVWRFRGGGVCYSLAEIFLGMLVLAIIANDRRCFRYRTVLQVCSGYRPEELDRGRSKNRGTSIWNNPQCAGNHQNGRPPAEMPSSPAAKCSDDGGVLLPPRRWHSCYAG